MTSVCLWQDGGEERAGSLRLDDKKHPLSLNVTVLTLNFDRCMQAAQ